jgi:ubiquinone/menaquinone biosynthesis C-methylase UbiE
MELTEEYYQDIHSKNMEPWNYSSRAAEVLRHLKVLNILRKVIAGSHASVLDIGCSLGQLTEKLIEFVTDIHALDISEIAIQKAKERCSADSSKVHFTVGNVIQMPFQDEQFSAVLACDGMAEWKLGANELTALSEIHRVLIPQGHAIFTDYLRPERFDSYIAVIAKSSLQIVGVQYLHDRLWYQFESCFKAIRNWPLVRPMLSSQTIAKFLGILSAFLGRHGSRHILIIAKKI